ncbi:MAG: bifunctional DNA-formamidopyrimidine glycosylase/DNA-(apurinic or apyrimidinic site) lyase [Pseudomonadota bacterium]
MPELPEVETVRRGLIPVMEGRRITAADVRRPDLRWPFPDRMAERLSGAKVDRLHRRSKYLLAELDTAETLIVHLGMSGRLLISERPLGAFHFAWPAAEKHDHVVLDIEGGARVTMNDARRFGAMDLWPSDRLSDHKLLAHIGPEPLGNAFHADWLGARFAGRRTPLKAALLDQRIVAGLGNIYVCEALWRAQLAPTRLAGEVSPPEIDALVRAIRSVLQEAITAGGSSLRDYRKADGELGYFQHAFKVYGREGEACAAMGCNGEITRIVQSGRSSFYCPVCQPDG